MKDVIKNNSLIIRNKTYDAFKIVDGITSDTIFENVIINDIWLDGARIENCKFINCIFNCEITSSTQYKYSGIRWTKFKNCEFKNCNGVIEYIRESTFIKNKNTMENCNLIIKQIDKKTWINGKCVGTGCWLKLNLQDYFK